MFERGTRIGCGARGTAVASCVLVLACAAAASTAGAASERETGVERSAAADVWLDKDSARARAGLSTRLAALARDRVAALPDAAQAEVVSLAPTGAGSLMRDGERLIVNIRVAAIDDRVLDAINDAGAEVLSVNRPYDSIDAALLPADLRALAAADGVEYVGENVVPMSSGIGPAAAAGRPGAGGKECRGSVTGEGDVQSGSAAARREFGVDGSGQKVAILSDSFDVARGAITRAEQDVRSGDLPGSGNPCGFTSEVEVFSEGAPIDLDEGRGMAQIVHDMAPGAEIAFATVGFSEDDMAATIPELADAGATVIVDDFTFFAEPYFQEGPIANAVSEVTARGIPYFSSAANGNVIVDGHDVASFEAPSFRPGGDCPNVLDPAVGAPPGQCMDFDPGGGTDVTYRLRVQPRSNFTVILQWAEPRYGVKTDLDLLFYDETAGTFQSVAATSNLGSQVPLEMIDADNPYPVPAYFDIVVFRSKGAGTPRLKFTFGRSRLTEVEYGVGTGGDVIGPTIFGHNGGADTITTGAISYDATSEPEPYSSRGPVVNYFGPVDGTTPAPPLASPQVLVKPDITATDNVRTTFFMPSPGDVPRFPGTSAAAPAAAAVAALQRQANPYLTPAQILAAEQGSAVPIGGFGPLAVGAGLIDGRAAVAANPPLQPRTRITEHPRRRIHRASARFEFGADLPGVHYRCRLGRRSRYEACESPVRVHGIKRGTKRTFRVRAFNGVAKDESPAKFRFRRVG